MKETFLKLRQGDITWLIQTPDVEEKDVIFYIGMTPCDDMGNYMSIGEMPHFVKEDTPLFDDKDAHSVVQVATKYGWAIVAKWFNNGSTRIYALRPEVIMETVAILSGACDSGICEPDFGEYVIRHKSMVDREDKKVFWGVMWWQI